MKILILTIIAYFIGNFSSAYLISTKFAHEDVRTQGSGNAGTTNMFRMYGYKLGIATLVLDVLKGYIAVMFARIFGGQVAGYFAAIGVVCGHNWPVLLGFKGGKGVATSLGVIFTISWQSGFIVLGIALIIIIATRRVALASLAGFVFYPFVVMALYPDNMPLKLCVLVLAALGIYSHRTNIKRLLAGTEVGLSFKPGGEKRNLK